MGLKCLVFLAVVAAACATSFYYTGPCPDNHQNGDRWNLDESCKECYCDHAGYGCSGCLAVTPVVGCYIFQPKEVMYPECCPRLKCPPVIPNI